MLSQKIYDIVFKPLLKKYFEGDPSFDVVEYQNTLFFSVRITDNTNGNRLRIYEVTENGFIKFSLGKDDGIVSKEYSITGFQLGDFEVFRSRLTELKTKHNFLLNYPYEREPILKDVYIEDLIPAVENVIEEFFLK